MLNQKDIKANSLTHWPCPSSRKLDVFQMIFNQFKHIRSAAIDLWNDFEQKVGLVHHLRLQFLQIGNCRVFVTHAPRCNELRSLFQCSNKRVAFDVEGRFAKFLKKGNVVGRIEDGMIISLPLEIPKPDAKEKR